MASENLPADLLEVPVKPKLRKKLYSKLFSGSFVQSPTLASPLSQQKLLELAPRGAIVTLGVGGAVGSAMARAKSNKGRPSAQDIENDSVVKPAILRRVLMHAAGVEDEVPWLQLRNRAMVTGVLFLMLRGTDNAADIIPTHAMSCLTSTDAVHKAVQWFKRRHPCDATSSLLYQPPSILDPSRKKGQGAKRTRTGTAVAKEQHALSEYSMTLRQLLLHSYPLPPSSDIKAAAVDAGHMDDSVHWAEANTMTATAEADFSNLSSGADGVLDTPLACLEKQESDCHAAGAAESTASPAAATPGIHSVLALDCEMVRTEAGMELARVSLVDGSSRATLLDLLVRPEQPVLDYLTRWSGMTEAMLQGAGVVSFVDARTQVLALLNASPGCMVAGHGLENDLNVLRIIHSRVVDTSVLFPHHAGGVHKNSLRWLASRYLKRAIQTGEDEGAATQGHSSIEDALAAMDLASLKATKGPSFGLPDAQAFFKGTSRRSAPPLSCSLLSARRPAQPPAAKPGVKSATPPPVPARGSTMPVWHRVCVVGSGDFVKLHQTSSSESISVLSAGDAANVVATAVKALRRGNKARLTAAKDGPAVGAGSTAQWQGPTLVVAGGEITVPQEFADQAEDATAAEAGGWDAALAAALPSMPHGTVVIVVCQGAMPPPAVQAAAAAKRRRTEHGDRAADATHVTSGTALDAGGDGASQASEEAEPAGATGSFHMVIGGPPPPAAAPSEEFIIAAEAEIAARHAARSAAAADPEDAAPIAAPGLDASEGGAATAADAEQKQNEKTA